jgi:precorrin-3B synthase
MRVMTVRGTCPTLTAPMMTGDGLLVRLALMRPGLTPDQLENIALAAAEFGNGLIDISARGNIQIRGLTATSLPALTRRIEALNILAPDRPAIAINPLAGIDLAIQGDPLEIAQSVRSRIDPTMVLAPKVALVIDGGGLLPLDTQTADIRLVAVRGRWLIALAGDATTATPLVSIDGQDAGHAVNLLFMLLASRGSTTRARDLLDVEGTAPFSAALADLDWSPPANYAPRTTNVIGRHTLSDGSPVLGIAAPFGQIDDINLARLAQTANALGGTNICPAPDRALLITGIAPERIDAMADAAAALGFVTDPADPRLHIAACTGTPACASGHFDTRAVARAISGRLPDITSRARQIHISGCAKGCARSSSASVTIVGRADGVGIVLNGRADGIPVAVLPHAQPSALVAQIDRIYGNTK